VKGGGNLKKKKRRVAASKGKCRPAPGFGDSSGQNHTIPTHLTKEKKNTIKTPKLKKKHHDRGGMATLPESGFVPVIQKASFPSAQERN